MKIMISLANRGFCELESLIILQLNIELGSEN